MVFFQSLQKNYKNDKYGSVNQSINHWGHTLRGAMPRQPSVVVVRELLATMKEGKEIYIEIEPLIDKDNNNGLYFVL